MSPTSRGTTTRWKHLLDSTVVPLHKHYRRQTTQLPKTGPHNTQQLYHGSVRSLELEQSVCNADNHNVEQRHVGCPDEKGREPPVIHVVPSARRPTHNVNTHTPRTPQPRFAPQTLCQTTARAQTPLRCTLAATGLTASHECLGNTTARIESRVNTMQTTQNKHAKGARTSHCMLRMCCEAIDCTARKHQTYA